MKTPINLDNTVFEFKTMVHSLPESKTWFKGRVIQMTDFGTVLIWSDDVPQDQALQKLIEDISINPVAPLFVAPDTWRMPQLLRALGAFKSATAASKNGWDKDIPEGQSEWKVRIANIKGVLTIHKVTTSNPWFTENVA